MMDIKFVILLQITSSLAAPMQFPLLPPMGTMQQQQLALQEQLLAIQQFQAMQRFNQPPPIAMNPTQPLLVLIPNIQPIEKDQLATNHLKAKPEQIEDEDTISIEAEPQENNQIDAKNTQVRAILLVPNNARFSLGEFISSISFLPIEINVPDSISWVYNGISSIISGIGQSWPFNRPQSGDQSEVNMKSVWKDMKMKEIMPIVVMPLNQPMVPIQF